MNDTTYTNRISLYRKYLKSAPMLFQPAQELESGSILESSELTDLYVLAPMANTYLIWVLQESVKLGIHRLYFLARDGYLMYRSARMYCEKLGLPLECRYFYCSRMSLRVPLYHLDHQRALDYICRGGISVTPEKLMIRSGFTSDQMDEIFSILQLGYERDETIPYAQLPDVRQKLITCQPYLDLLDHVSQAALPALEGYFRQEGMLEDHACAIVDSGWTGSMQRSIQKARKVLGCDAPLWGFYFGLYELPSDADASFYRSLYFTPLSELRRKVFFNNNLFEVVFSAPHPTTVGYQQSGLKYVPVFGTELPQIKQYLSHFEPLLSQYTALLLKHFQAEDFRSTDPGVLMCVLDKPIRILMYHPCSSEASQYGSLPFSDDLMDCGRQNLAAPLDLVQIRQNHLFCKLIVMLGLKKSALKESAWYAGTVQLYSHFPQWHQLQYALYKFLVFLRKTFRNRRTGK